MLVRCNRLRGSICILLAFTGFIGWGMSDSMHQS
jgi:hypothetical protein